MHTSALCEKIRDRLKKSDLWGSRSKETQTHFQGLLCPECGKPEAWAYTDAPFSIICNRKNECGAKVRALDLWPELLINVEKDYAPTKDDPNRPAREYLHSRGLNRSLAGLTFEYWRNIRGTPSGGVMFPVGKNPVGEDVWNGRLFNPPQGEGKTHNKGGTAGVFWKHPGIEYDFSKPTYMTEGILDALSLIEMGYQAISVLTSGQDPAKLDLGSLAVSLVIAFDADSAGASGFAKWKKQYPNARAIAPTSGDWNDFLCSYAPDQAAQAFLVQLPRFESQAKLLLAETPDEYALAYKEGHGRPPELFAFDRCYWSAFEKASKSAMPEMIVYRVSNFTAKVDHYQLDKNAEDKSIYRYYLKILPRKGGPIMCSIEGDELATPRSIRSALLTHARVMWKGEARPSAAFADRIVDTGAPIVRQCHILGLDIKSGYSIFRDFAVDPSGKVMELDKQGFFRVSRKEFLRPPSIATLTPKRGIEPQKVFDLINGAWPDNGPLAMAYTVASWFVNSIKPELGFFPFLSLHGKDTQTGKTRLVRIMNALQCLDEEGLPMTKLNTGKGEIRKLAQRSGLFKALLEGNKEDKLRFDLESLLTLYNYGNSLQVRATKTNDIQTHETQFLSSLIFVQNLEPFKGKAQMERVISSRPFRNEDITEQTTEAFNELMRIPARELAYCYLKIMAYRKAIEANWAARYTAAREEIFGEIFDNRVAENHGLMLAFHRILAGILKVDYDLKPFLIEIAKRKHQQCNHRQATLADSFFEAINDLPDDMRDKFLEVKEAKIMIKLPLAIKSLSDRGYQFPHMQVIAELKEHPAFIRSNFSYRGYFGATVADRTKVWIFDAARVLGGEGQRDEEGMEEGR